MDSVILLLKNWDLKLPFLLGYQAVQLLLSVPEDLVHPVFLRDQALQANHVLPDKKQNTPLLDYMFPPQLTLS